MPNTSALRFVSGEFSLEESLIGVNPFAGDELSLIELADVFLFCQLDDVGSLSFFLTVAPVS